jgi:hypothetical protein
MVPHRRKRVLTYVLDKIDYLELKTVLRRMNLS